MINNLTWKKASYIPVGNSSSLSSSVADTKVKPGCATRSTAIFRGGSFSRSCRWAIKGKTSKTPNGTGSPPASIGTAKPLDIESPMKTILTFLSWQFGGNHNCSHRHRSVRPTRTWNSSQPT